MGFCEGGGRGGRVRDSRPDIREVDARGCTTIRTQSAIHPYLTFNTQTPQECLAFWIPHPRRVLQPLPQLQPYHSSRPIRLSLHSAVYNTIFTTHPFNPRIMSNPIHHLPVETLAAIFIFYSSCYEDSPLELLWVCGFWRAVALATPRIWSKVRLCTWTNVGKVAFILARTVTSPLHVEIDTIADSLMSRTHKSPRYLGLWEMAMQANRWRSLTITSFPPEECIELHFYLRTLSIAFGRPLEGLRSLRIRHTGGISLLPIIPFPHNKINNMEISLCSVLYYFMQPQFVTIFHALIRFKVTIWSMSTEVDILSQFYWLETLEASHLHLPVYPVETDLRLVHTLKYMKINNVSVQWMAGRTFPNLKECEIIEPLNPETISPGFGVNLPVCMKFTYDAESIDTLVNFCIPLLDILTIRSNVLLEDMGSSQLAAVWSAAPSEAALLMPRVLYLDTRCHEQHLIKALSMLPQLEELHLSIRSENGLSQMFFASLQAEEKQEWGTQVVTHVCRRCPSLKSLSIYYSFWATSDTANEITPLLHQLAKSRQKTEIALQDVKFWQKLTSPWGSASSNPWGSPLRSDPWLSLCE